MRAGVRLAVGVAAALAATGLGTLAALRRHDGPVGPLPGGALTAGPLVREAPPDWAKTGLGETLELEVRPQAPWSVTTWAVVHRGALYVAADFLNPVKRWPYFVRSDPDVIVRVGGRRYPCRAVRIEDPAVIAAVREAFARKYAISPDGPVAHTEVWLFRLDPRPAEAAPRS